jgi:hypothetical protein
LVPVDYQPNFDDYSLVPVDHDPFAEDGLFNRRRSNSRRHRLNQRSQPKLSRNSLRRESRSARRQRADDRRQPQRIGWRRWASSAGGGRRWRLSEPQCGIGFENADRAWMLPSRK